MSLEQITSADSGRKGRKRVGRGAGSGLGKTCGRGEKGQTSRSGGGRGRFFEGGQFPFWMRLPKRGFSNVNHETKYQVIPLARAAARVDGDTISVDALVAAGLAKKGELIKLVSGTAVESKLTIQVHKVTGSVKQAVEAAGGSIEVLHG